MAADCEKTDGLAVIGCFRKLRASNMLPGQPSQTLLASAIRRGQHQLFDSPPILNDPVVLALVPEAKQPDILAEMGNPSEPLPTLLRALMAMRSRFAEDRLAQAAARSIGQYVIIGAGLDTFPWRQPKFAGDLQIFAVDHPVSLGWVQQRLRDRRLGRPANLTHVPADLERQALGEQLKACGFDPKVPTFCSVLGVLQYLDPSAVDALLRFAAGLVAGSEIVLSFVADEPMAGDDRDALAQCLARMDRLNEPWKYQRKPAELLYDLASLGFTDVFHLTPDLAHQRYFANRSDQLRAPRWEQLIAARL
jgi:methyltransferase (TIGR00027 family)